MAAKPKKTVYINVYVVTFNCGGTAIDVDAFGSQFFDGLESPRLPEIIVLSLQELAPIADSFLGGDYLLPYLRKFTKAVQKGAAKLPSPIPQTPYYAPIQYGNAGGTGMIVFVQFPGAVRDVEFAAVGVGMAEMANKGATAVRFKYGNETLFAEMTFVAAHLAAMEDQVARRNEDWKNIVKGLVFFTYPIQPKNFTSLPLLQHMPFATQLPPLETPPSSSAEPTEGTPLLSISSQDASIYKSTSMLFVAGDLNYRTSTIKPSPTDHIDTFPQPHNDESSPKHFSSLFERDQLTQELAAGRTLHGLIEAPITFPPTYKYESKEPFLTPDEDLSKWHWAKHRWPSWCDRILYLDMPAWVKAKRPDAKITPLKYSALPLQPTTDHRAVAMHFFVPLVPIPKPNMDAEAGNDDPRVHPPFDINIDLAKRGLAARNKEIIVGWAAYYSTTRKGNAVVLATLVGLVAGLLAVRALWMDWRGLLMMLM